MSPKFFYDALGSRLFDAITELAEYYPTRTEAAIFAATAPAIAAAVLARHGRDAGDGRPGRRQLRQGGAACSARWRRGATWRWTSRWTSCAQSLQQLQREHPALDLLGVGLDFSARLALPADAGGRPGAGVLPRLEHRQLRARPTRCACCARPARLAAGGALLIGVDLVKPAALLEAAYDDALGVTAAFNLNLLRT